MQELTQAPTWLNSSTETQIDYIWVLKQWRNSIANSKVDDMTICTRSDYKLIRASILMGLEIRNAKPARWKHHYRKRVNIDVSSATKEEWKEYQEVLDKKLKD